MGLLSINLLLFTDKFGYFLVYLWGKLSENRTCHLANPEWERTTFAESKMNYQSSIYRYVHWTFALFFTIWSAEVSLGKKMHKYWSSYGRKKLMLSIKINGKTSKIRSKQSESIDQFHQDIFKFGSKFVQLLFFRADGLRVLPNRVHILQFWAPKIIEPPCHTTFLAYLITWYV